MSEPAFSVVIPAYNAARTLPETLDSVFAQPSDLPFEVIVVDDGSTDDTARIAAGYPGLRVLAKSNGGASSARNAGVRVARSQIVAFLDADDRVLEGRFAVQIPFMLANPQVDLSFGSWIVEGEPGSYLARYGLTGSPTAFQNLDNALERLLTAGCFVPTSTVAVRRDSLVAAGGFPEDRHYAEDYALFLRIAASGGRLAFMDRPFAWYRTQSGTRLSRSSKTYLGFVQTLREALLEYGPGLSEDAYRRTHHRYARGVDVLLRHEWAYGGRERVLARIAELAPLMPHDLRIKYTVLSHVPAIAPRIARSARHWFSRAPA